MVNWGEKIEHVVDSLIPYALLLLLFVLVCEFFFKNFYEHYHTFFLIGDYLIIAVFVSDIFFKYRRARSIPKFLKESWLDVLVIFPFFLIFRVLEALGILAGVVEAFWGAQKLAHAGVEIKKEIDETAEVNKEVKLVSELEKEADIIHAVETASKHGPRSEKLAKFIRPIAPHPRIFKGVKFYEHPKRNIY